MPPIPVEVANSLQVYDPATDKWFKGLWSIFREDGANKYAAINFSLAETKIIITGTAGKRICVSAIVLVVGGETNLTLYDASTAISGPMDLGGSSEPRGMVIPLGITPLELGFGNDFKIGSSIAVQVSGTVIYQLV